MRQGRGPGYKSVLQWSAVLLGAIALWTCVSMVRTQMKYLNHQVGTTHSMDELDVTAKITEPLEQPASCHH
jgi:ABC-type nickel/cobalt efflux system permease component RcnA